MAQGPSTGIDAGPAPFRVAVAGPPGGTPVPVTCDVVLRCGPTVVGRTSSVTEQDWPGASTFGSAREGFRAGIDRKHAAAGRQGAAVASGLRDEIDTCRHRVAELHRAHREGIGVGDGDGQDRVAANRDRRRIEGLGDRQRSGLGKGFPVEEHTTSAAKIMARTEVRREGR